MQRAMCVISRWNDIFPRDGYKIRQIFSQKSTYENVRIGGYIAINLALNNINIFIYDHPRVG